MRRRLGFARALRPLAPILVSGCIQLGPQNKDDDQASDPVDAGLATPLIGFWSYDDSATLCAYTLTFGMPTLDSYQADTYCQLTDGTLGLQTRVGTYTVPMAGNLAVTIASSTCAVDGTNEIDFTFAQSGQGLNMDGAEGNVIVYAPAKRGSPRVTVTSGCFGSDGSFTPAELKPL
jgi:hypothetical protein